MSTQGSAPTRGEIHMHIIAGIVALIGMIAFFIIRANNTARAGRETVDTVDDMNALKRKWDWQRNAGDGTLPEVDDARLAATAIMCAIAASEGDLTEKQTTHIRQSISNTFGLNASDAEDFLGQGRWLAGQVAGPDGAVLRWWKPISESCSVQEQAQAVELLESTATVESAVSDEQRHAIQLLKTRLGL